MKIGRQNIQGVAPVSRSGGAKTRHGRHADAADVSFDQESAARTSLPAVIQGSASQSRTDRSSARPGLSGTVATQLLAQRSTGKSDRRLARYFPERVHAAYIRAATAPQTVQTGLQRSV